MDRSRPPLLDDDVPQTSFRTDVASFATSLFLVPMVFVVATVSGLCETSWMAVPTVLLAAVPGWVAFDSGRSLWRRR